MELDEIEHCIHNLTLKKDKKYSSTGIFFLSAKNLQKKTKNHIIKEINLIYFLYLSTYMKEKIKEVIKSFQNKTLKVSHRNIEIPLDSWKIVSIIWARRVGKTFLLYEIIEKLKITWIRKEYILYFNFEDDRFEFDKHNLDLIISAYRELYPETNLEEIYIFFDEIQEIDSWEVFVRRIYDNITKKIFLTWSSSKLLSKELSTNLRWRSISYELYPLSFREFLHFKNISVDIYDENSIYKIKSEFNKYLLGSYPEIIHYDEEIRQKTYKEYLNVMIFKDLIERYKIRNEQVLGIFIKKVLSNISKDFSINKFYNEIKSMWLKVSKDLIYEIPRYLEDIYLAFFVLKYDESVSKMETSSKKVYSEDLGFTRLFLFDLDNGRQLENLVFIELKRRWSEIYYHRNKKECDFLIRDRWIITEAIQVSWSLYEPATKKREIDWLIEALELYNLETWIILTYDDKEEKINIKWRNIKVVPIWKWIL